MESEAVVDQEPTPIIEGDITNGFDLFRLGDPRTGWFPKPTEMKEFVNLLKDIGYSRPFMVYNYAVRVEVWDGKYVFLLGDDNLGRIPSPKDQEKFAKALEGHLKGSAIIYHFGVRRTSVNYG